jgi:hypothetical protein
VGVAYTDQYAPLQVQLQHRKAQDGHDVHRPARFGGLQAEIAKRRCFGWLLMAADQSPLLV